MNFLTLLLQISTESTQAATQAAEQIRMSYWQLAVKGGWVMIPIALLSILGVYIFIERYLAIKKASTIDNNFMNRIRDYIHEGKVENALTLCESYTDPASKMIEKGIRRIGRSLADINTAIEIVGKIEIAKLEKGLPVLASVAGGAPMLGFFGTVTGMVRAFYDMSMAGNNIDITLLSSGIYIALITTVGGLLVGIPAFFGYNYLVTRIENLVNKLEANSTEFMDILNEPVSK
jgi:biopolymer transport protein ExbB